MRNKFLITMGMTAGLALLAVSLATAQTATPTPSPTAPSPSPLPPIHAMPMLLEVGSAGHVLLRGTIDSVSGNSLTVKSWGGDWTVNIGPNTKVLPAGKNVIEYKDGDFVGIQGTVSQSANWTIDATLVRDWTYRQAANRIKSQNLIFKRGVAQSGTPRNFQGTVTTAPTQTAVGWSWMISVDGVSYTVNVAANAKVLNRNWLTLPLSSIQNGDTVRVWGSNSNGTITAEIVRDISIPKLQTQSNITVTPPDGVH